LGARR